jgi:hypothetical protein
MNGPIYSNPDERASVRGGKMRVHRNVTFSSSSRPRDFGGKTFLESKYGLE